MYTDFGWLDYGVFITTLCISLFIGIYFGCFGSKQKSSKEYLYGDKKMSAIPVGLSLYSSAISSVTIVGIPSEVYVFGTQYLTSIFGTFISVFFIWAVFLPVFCGNLHLKTPYEYFEQRFGYNIRLMASTVYILHTILYMPVILYASTLSLSEVTGIPLLVCTSTVGATCVFYTTLGGFKSVIWTDTLQATLMIVSCFVVVVLGVGKAGGLTEMWDIAERGGRAQFFNFDPNPFVRVTAWSAILGMIFLHAAHSGCSASALQRYMSLGTQKEARKATIIGFIGLCAIYLVTCLMGLSMYAIYADCDPVKNKLIASSNQMVPYFIQDTIGHIPGFTGFFIAGLLSAGLSSLSAEMNTVGGLIYHDFILKFYKDNKFVESNGALIMKVIVMANGVLYLCIVPFLQKSKHIYQFTVSIGGFTYGAKLGILLLGVLCPKANSKGAIVGTLVSMVTMAWVIFSGLYQNVNSHYILPLSDGCGNITIVSNTTVQNEFTKFEDIFFLFKLSFAYYPLAGACLVIVIGLLVSYATGVNDTSKMDPLLIAPFLRSFVYKETPRAVELEAEASCIIE